MEDLGGGLKLDFAAQIAWNTANNAGLSNRNSHIGLVGESWGGVWYGSNENIYERYFYTHDPLDGAAGLGGNLQILGNPGAGSVFRPAATARPVQLTLATRAGLPGIAATSRRSGTTARTGTASPSGRWCRPTSTRTPAQRTSTPGMWQLGVK